MPTKKFVTVDVHSGVGLIAAERDRQIDEYPAGHDSVHDASQLLQAAHAYALQAARPTNDSGAPMIWPWTEAEWKPKRDDAGRIDVVANLVVAGALIAAEIDRLQYTGRKCGSCGAPATIKMPGDWFVCEECHDAQ